MEAVCCGIHMGVSGLLFDWDDAIFVMMLSAGYSSILSTMPLLLRTFILHTFII